MKLANLLKLTPLLALLLASTAKAGALDNWTNVANANYGDIDQIIYGNGLFVAIGNNSGPPPRFYLGGYSTSSDGIHWQHSGDPTYNYTGLAYANGVFVLAKSGQSGDAGAIEYLTTNGGGEFIGSPGLPGLTGVAYGNGVFVAVGFDYEYGLGVSYISTNGQIWSSTEFYIGDDFYPSGIAFGNGGFIVPGEIHQSSNNNYIYRATNGMYWGDISPSIDGVYNGISCVNGIFTTSAFYSNNLTYYANGNGFGNGLYVWTTVTPPLAQSWLTTSGTNSLYLSVGTGTVLSSSNYNTNWQSHSIGSTNVLNCIASGNGLIVAGTLGGGIFVSGNITPSLSAQNQSHSGVLLSISGGLGPTYQLQASTNLSTWTNLTTFTNIGTGVQYLDPSAGTSPRRYYRTVSP